VLLLVVLACGCSPSQKGPAPTIAVLPCNDAIGSVATPLAGDKVIFDSVALPTARALQATRASLTDPTAGLFAKDGLLIKRGATFDLVVPDEWTGRLKIGWGSPGEQTKHLRVPGCQPHTTLNQLRDSDPWVAYAGGYWIDRPACVKVLVEAGQQTQAVSIGVGIACPGQTAPPSP
jgi:hypothetical protein